MQTMNENSSQTIKELSEDQEIKNSSELDKDSASQNEEDLSFEKSDIPSADSSSSRTNTDFDTQDSHKKNLHHFWASMTIISSLAI